MKRRKHNKKDTDNGRLLLFLSCADNFNPAMNLEHEFLVHVNDRVSVKTIAVAATMPNDSAAMSHPGQRYGFTFSNCGMMEVKPMEA